MVELRYRSDMPQSTAERINKRLRNSGVGQGSDLKPDVTVQTGNSARRTFHNIHHSAGHVSPPVKPTHMGETK